MSSLYNLEPQPTGKVILHTTSGDLLLELFAQQIPLASRNFLQLCLDGYYDNTIFHRLVPGFIIQGGDPTGTGSGGQSSFDGGKPFADEFHSRLKFNRRGLLGMANTGESDDNGSQFFLTLGTTPELTGRNTMFGRVEGNTIFNLVKMGEADLVDDEGSERPMYPTRITGTEVLVNPFEGMEPRMRVAPRTVQGTLAKKKPVKKKAGKQLLSFGGDEGEDTVSITPAAKFNPKLVEISRPLATPLPAAAKRPAPPLLDDRASKRRLSPSPSRIIAPISVPVSTPATVLPLAPQQISATPRTSRISPSSSPTPSIPAPQPSLLEVTNAQIAALKSSLKRNIPAAVSTSSAKKSALEAMIPATSIRGRKRKGNIGSTGVGTLSKEEQRTVDEFNAFKRKLDSVTSPVVTLPKDTEDEGLKAARQQKGIEDPAVEDQDQDEEAHLCDLHFIVDCQSCGRWDRKRGSRHNGATSNNSNINDGNIGSGDAGKEEGGNEEEESEGEFWLSHQLTFAKDRLGKDLEWKRQNEKELLVIDPREKERDLGIKVDRGRGRDRGKR